MGTLSNTQVCNPPLKLVEWLAVPEDVGIIDTEPRKYRCSFLVCVFILYSIFVGGYCSYIQYFVFGTIHVYGTIHRVTELKWEITRFPQQCLNLGC